MTNFLKNLLLACISIGFYACNNAPKATSSKPIDPSILDQNLLDSTGTLIPQMADSAIVLYMLAYQNPANDTMAPYYLLRAADLQRNLPGKALMAVKKYNDLKTKYPEHKLAPAALFMIGLTFDQNLNDPKRAAKAYADFIENYPNHPMINQAKDLYILATDTTKTELDNVHQWLKNN